MRVLAGAELLHSEVLTTWIGVVVVLTTPYCVCMGLNLARTLRHEALNWTQMSFDCVVGTMGGVRPLLQVVIAPGQVSHSLQPDMEAKARMGR